jgi:hypothetical protein
MEVYLSREQKWQMAWSGAVSLAGRGGNVVVTEDGGAQRLGEDEAWLAAEPWAEAKRCASVDQLLTQEIRTRVWGTVQSALRDAAEILDAGLPDAIQCEGASENVCIGYSDPDEPVLVPAGHSEPSFLVDVVCRSLECGLFFPLGFIYGTFKFLQYKWGVRRVHSHA